MLYQQPTPSAKAPAPPIPKMEAPPPVPPSSDRRSVLDPALAQGPVGIPGTQPPFPINPRDMIPTAAVDMVMGFFVTCVFIIIGWPLARALARRIDRRTEAIKVGGADIEPQLRQLQESVDAMAIEVERISEGQRFTAKLMAERVGAAPRLEGESRG